MKSLHSIGYMHNDLKPENIILDKDRMDKIFLIDFGLSEAFLEHTQEHVEQKTNCGFTGNIMFASLNACRGLSKARRDDLESAFYLIIYLLNRNTLPWSFVNSDIYAIKYKL